MEGREYMHSSKKRRTVCIISICIALAVVVGIFSYLAVGAMTDQAYDGVYVGDINVGRKDAKEIEEIISNAYSKGEINPVFECDGEKFQIYSSEVYLSPNFETTAIDATCEGKDGNIFYKIYKMLSLKTHKKVLDVSLECDMNLLEYALREHLEEKMADVIQPDVEIGSDCLILTNGKAGKGVNTANLMKKISFAYTNGELSKPIEVKIETLTPDIIDAEIFIKEYNRAPQDAVCKSDGENINIIPEIVGVKVDPDETRRIIENNKNNHNPYTIPAVITYPEVSAKELEAEFTDCIIGTFSTDYSTSSANRKENIRLASEKINGLILNPGEEFSFNGVVGPRTASNGYKIAQVYVGSKTVDGIGGGICQVSSTLYNSAVLADLEIVYRTNHSKPVSYVPLGRDATVSYGTIDFIFKNNKETPVKIETIADGSKLTINIYGRKKYLKDISIETVITGTRAYSVTEIKDDTMYEGERVTEEKGSNGIITQSYKIVKENGETISRTNLAKSSYSPISQVDRVGTKKRESDPVISDDNSVINSDASEIPQDDAEVIAPVFPSEPEPETEPDLYQSDSSAQ